jgi:cytochrome c556
MRSRVLALGLGGAIAVALIGTGTAGLLEDREATMRQISRNFRPLADLAKHNRFDAARAAQDAAAIAAQLDRFKDLFPPGSEHADRAAKPEIWSDRPAIEKARLKAAAAATALAQAVDLDAFRAAVARLNDACGSCHHAYRADP